MTPTKVYILYACDDCKTAKSAWVLHAATTDTKIMKAVISRIQRCQMKYGKGQLSAPEKQVLNLKEDWRTTPLDVINEKLCGGYIEVMSEELH